MTQPVSDKTETQGSHWQWQTLFLCYKPCSPLKVLSNYFQKFPGSISCMLINRSSQPRRIYEVTAGWKATWRHLQVVSLCDHESPPIQIPHLLMNCFRRCWGPWKLWTFELVFKRVSWASMPLVLLGPEPRAWALACGSQHPWSHTVPLFVTLGPKHSI